MRWLSLIFIAYLVTASISWGDDPNIPNPHPSQTERQQDNTPSNDRPITIQLIPRQKTEEEIAKENANERKKSEIDERMAALTADLVFYTKLLFLATAVLAVITGGLVCFGFQQTRDMKKSIAASELSVRISAETLAAAQRPWIHIESARVVGPLIYNTSGLHLTVRYDVKNVGNTPALFVLPELRIFPGYGCHDVQDEMRRFSRECRERVSRLSIDERRHPGGFIFPHQPTEPLQIGTSIGVLEPGVAGKPFMIYLLAIVQYVSPVDREWHQTGIMFDLFRRVKGQRQLTSSFEPNQVNIPSGELEARRDVMGAYAD